MDMLRVDACTLPDAERTLRLAEFDSLFAEAVVGLERNGDAARLTLSGPTGLRERVLDLVERESRCCSFFDFTLQGVDDDLELVIAVPPEHRDVLAALADRASRLSS
jgi:hypothetical protein